MTSGASVASRELHAVFSRGCFEVIESGAHPVNFPHQPSNIGAER